LRSKIAKEFSLARLALIVGAGIGGLSAAIALRRAGWDVRVFERSPAPRELGFGVGLAPNAIGALVALGIGDVVVARGFEPTRAEVRRPDGMVLRRVDLPRGLLGGPFVVALRPALHGALFDAVGADAIRAGAEATRFTTAGDRVTLHFADGQRTDGDVLIGADGVGSMMRRQLHPDEPPPRSSRILAVRGAVDGMLHHFGGREAVYYLGPGIESAFIRASETGMYWFLSMARELVPPGLSDPAAVTAHVAQRFDAAFRAVTTATTELRIDELVDRDPLPFWGTGRITLLGDAAHPMLPHTGQGAAQAIVDAVALGRRLTGDPDIGASLRAYERERQPKTSALVRQGRRTARLMRIRNPIACALREALLRMVPLKTGLRFYVRVNRRAGTDVEAA
jgi:2-polyprenyl-6-methoxyphenol hydroxylase-like FAD-dependent oxidoreductase